MREGIEKEEEPLQTEEVAFALTGFIASLFNPTLLIFPEIILRCQPLFLLLRQSSKVGFPAGAEVDVPAPESADE